MREAGPGPVAVGYVRVSTAEQATSGLGLDAQRAAIAGASTARGWQLVETFEDAGVSSTARRRPGLDAAVAACGGSHGSILIVARLDRLARSLLSYANLVDRAQREGWRLLALDSPDASTAGGEAMQGVMAVFAAYERRLISERTREALAAAQARGVRLGRPTDVSDQVAAQILELRRRRHLPARAIARQLQDEGVPPPRGGERWHASTVARLLSRSGVRLQRGRPRRRRRHHGLAHVTHQ